MLTLKRLYLYTVLGITLAVMLIGLNDVVRIAFDVIGDAVASRSYISDDLRAELSWALALLIVSVPLFLVHAVLVRGTLAGAPLVVAEERACSTRATYFFLVLAGTGLIAVVRAFELGDSVVGAVLFGERAWGLAGSAAGVVVMGGAWLAHLWARRADLRSAPRQTAADWLTRAYLYGALFLAAIVTCVGVGNLLTVLARVLLDLRPAWEYATWWHHELSWSVALTVVAGSVWLLHWALSLRLVHAPSSMGQAHRASRTRAGYFQALALVSAATALAFVAMGLRSAFAGLLDTWQPADGSRLVEDVGGPLLLAVPFAIACWWHLRRAAAEARAFGSPALERATRRTGRLGLAFVGLAGLAIGLAWELQALLDAISSAGRATLFSTEAIAEVSMSALATALVGLLLWAPVWASLQRQRARATVEVASATSRRAYLLLVCGVATVALMLALAFVIYQATRMLLGTELIDDASWALAVLVVAAVVLAYHLYCLRGDMLVARTVEPATGSAELARSSETLEITAPAGADLEAFNEAIRSELPDGFELRIRSHA